MNVFAMVGLCASFVAVLTGLAGLHQFFEGLGSQKGRREQIAELRSIESQGIDMDQSLKKKVVEDLLRKREAEFLCGTAYNSSIRSFYVLYILMNMLALMPVGVTLFTIQIKGVPAGFLGWSGWFFLGASVIVSSCAVFVWGYFLVDKRLMIRDSIQVSKPSELPAGKPKKFKVFSFLSSKYVRAGVACAITFVGYVSTTLLTAWALQNLEISVQDMEACLLAQSFMLLMTAFVSTVTVLGYTPESEHVGSRSVLT